MGVYNPQTLALALLSPHPALSRRTRVGFSQGAMCSLLPLPGRERAGVRVPAHGASSPLTQTLSPSGGEGDQGGRPCPVTQKTYARKALSRRERGNRTSSRCAVASSRWAPGHVCRRLVAEPRFLLPDALALKVMCGLPRPERPQVGRRRVPRVGQGLQDAVEFLHLDG